MVKLVMRKMNQIL